MRLLHTSDWHLGRSLHRADLGPAQQSFVDHLVETVRAERVEAVLLAGDVYDRAVPPLEAVALFTEALRRVRDAGAQVIAISGNHDSPLRLGTHSDLLATAGVHLRTRVAGCGSPVVLADEHGGVPVYALPYLEPDATRAQLGPEVGRGHQQVIGAALDRVRVDLAARDSRRAVVVAHGWVTGAEVSDSERDNSVGGVGAVPASLFDGLAYVALGHLHRPQGLADHLRYSGSPLPYSFSEAGHRKGSWLVEMASTGRGAVEFIPAPVQRELARLRGPLTRLLTAAEYAGHEHSYVAITLTDRTRPAEAMDRLRDRFPYVLTLTWEPPVDAKEPANYVQLLRGRSDLEVAEGFVGHVRGEPAVEEERALFADAFTAVRSTAA